MEKLTTSGIAGDDRYLTTKEAARVLGISHRTMEGWRLTGEGPPFCRAGRRRVLYSLLALKDYLAERTFRNTGEAILALSASIAQGLSGAAVRPHPA